MTMDVRDFLKPTVLKLLITLFMPVPVYFAFTQNIENVLDFYWYLLTPWITVYTDVLYKKFNSFILLWIPFYLSACLILEGYRLGTRLKYKQT